MRPPQIVIYISGDLIFIHISLSGHETMYIVKLEVGYICALCVLRQMMAERNRSCGQVRWYFDPVSGH